MELILIVNWSTKWNLGKKLIPNVFECILTGPFDNEIDFYPLFSSLASEKAPVCFPRLE
jgi:hypothetical protein